MKRLSPEAWIALVLLASLIVIAVFTSLLSGTDAPPKLASFSNAPDGARAFRLWLDSAGYITSSTAADTFHIPPDTDMVFILEPADAITDNEWEAIDEWVEAGGILYLVGSGWNSYQAFLHYEFRLQFSARNETIPADDSPLLSSPPVTGPVVVKTDGYLDPQREDYTVLLAAPPPQGPVLVSIQHGQGQVIIGTIAYTFSNAGLKESGNPRVMLNLMRLADGASAAGAGRNVWFDEWHHGVRGVTSGEAAGPDEWLRYTPTGRALLFSVLVIFAALVMRGRSFGRPLRPASEITRRSPLEYVTALANLSRQAGHRAPVLRQYYTRLKRQLARRYRLDPGLPDEEYVRQLAALNPGLESGALLHLLTRLQAKKVSENEMVQLAQEASHWLKEIER